MASDNLGTGCRSFAHGSFRFSGVLGATRVLKRTFAVSGVVRAPCQVNEDLHGLQVSHLCSVLPPKTTVSSLGSVYSVSGI